MERPSVQSKEHPRAVRRKGRTARRSSRPWICWSVDDAAAKGGEEGGTSTRGRQGHELHIEERTMSDATRLQALKIVLVVVGIISIVGVYPLMIVWPAGWTWHTGYSDYPLMIVG